MFTVSGFRYCTHQRPSSLQEPECRLPDEDKDDQEQQPRYGVGDLVGRYRRSRKKREEVGVERQKQVKLTVCLPG